MKSSLRLQALQLSFALSTIFFAFGQYECQAETLNIAAKLRTETRTNISNPNETSSLVSLETEGALGAVTPRDALVYLLFQGQTLFLSATPIELGSQTDAVHSLCDTYLKPGANTSYDELYQYRGNFSLINSVQGQVVKCTRDDGMNTIDEILMIFAGSKITKNSKPVVHR